MKDSLSPKATIFLSILFILCFLPSWGHDIDFIRNSAEYPFGTSSEDKHRKALKNLPKELAGEQDVNSLVHIDPRDGNSYAIIHIGEQTWMKENLNYRTENSWCYNNDYEFCSLYGRLYTWESALNACPEGWKLPDTGNWMQLTKYLLNEHDLNNNLEDEHGLGNALKSCRQVNSPLGGLCNTQQHPRWEPNEINFGFDSFGFSALPGGYRHASGAFSDIGYLGHWWSASRAGYLGKIKSIYRGYSDLRSNTSNVNYAFSVRCIKKKETENKTHAIQFDVFPVNAGIVSEEMRLQEGEMIIIEATPEDGYHFVSWTKQGKVISTKPGFEFLMPSGNVRLTAHFLPENHVIMKGDGVLDVDGNFYKTIYMGEQEWMAENLKTTRYNDGTPIERVASGKQNWSDKSCGAYTWYANNQANKDLYGALYNWHAVNNKKGLCPMGWRIPGIEDLADLLRFLGEENQENNAYKLKSCRQVDSPLHSKCATHEQPRWDFHDKHYGVDIHGFNGLGAGKKKPDGAFESLGETAYWWLSNKSRIGNLSWFFSMNHESSQVSRNIIEPAYGYSVRCVRDKAITYAERPAFSLEIFIVPDSAGKISGEGNYYSGDSVFVNAIAEDGYVFVSWSDQDRAIISNNPGFSFVMPENNHVLSASFKELPGDGTRSTISDIEGNVYETILLGELEWMAENLRTRYYHNGTPIDYPGDNKDLWLNNISGAYAWFDNEGPANDQYGALYNWHTVINTNGICPYGWRVPTHDDWTKLEQFVCKELNNSMCHIRFPFDNHTTGWRGTNEGNALKITSASADSMYSSGTIHTNDWQMIRITPANRVVGFNALPAGFRFTDGSFFSSGNNAYWWSSSEHGTDNAWARGITSNPTGIARFSMNKNNAFSLRCVRDLVHKEND